MGLGRDKIFFFFVGVGQERFENPLLCHPLVYIRNVFYNLLLIVYLV